MSVKGIIMFLGMNNIRLERKVLIILDFENGFLPTYLPQCVNLLFPSQPRSFNTMHAHWIHINSRQTAQRKKRGRGGWKAFFYLSYSGR